MIDMSRSRCIRVMSLSVWQVSGALCVSVNEEDLRWCPVCVGEERLETLCITDLSYVHVDIETGFS